ncbi:MAG: hypothetical protein M3209_12775 [Acidobacteriota bacterium]|nr:hypothetical protein [Acidobacteriota bacterium]
MRRNFWLLTTTILFAFVSFSSIAAQETGGNRKKGQTARPITIPISVRAGNVKVSETRGEVIEAGNITVKENGEERTILSLRKTSESPMHFAVLIQEDVDATVNLELEGIANFIRRLPRGSRVMVAYLRGGTIQIRQKFTEDLEKASKSLRILGGSSASPFNPYVGVMEAVERFENLPLGRRAMLVVSDGLDIGRGIDSASPAQSMDLDRAILKAQRNGIAVYTIYAATPATNGNSRLASFGQSSLLRLADETGGRAFFSGLSTPVSFSPFLRELGASLSRQFALTYLSTEKDNRFRRIEIISDSREVVIEYPKGVNPK